MENHQGNAVYPAQLAMDNPIIVLGLETGQDKPGGGDKDDGVRKSVRCKRPPQSFSPGLESATGERYNESSKTKKLKTKSATAPDRPCDLMPNGITFDRPRKPRKIIPMPTAEEMEKILKGAKDFGKKLVVKTNRPEAERLYCPVVRPKACGCLQKYIIGDGGSDEFDIRAKAMIDLLMKARELSAEKCYAKKTESNGKGRSSKNQGVGIGNGQKRSKAFEDFVLTQRTHLKTDLKLCERAVQKVLLYSNNFLHKKLVTEKSLCRAKPVNGMARKGLLQPFDTISQTRCCVDNCVMMAITHKKLLQDWRDRANKGQSEHRRVIAEMLTPSAGARTNCYTFITLVTGASRSTIVQVSHQMKQTGGEREPPTHGMKKFWQSNSHRKSTEAMSLTKVPSHLGKTSTNTTFTHSVAPASKQSVVAASCNPTTTTSNIVIPVSVSGTSSGTSSLTVQRQQLMQIQQQMFEQQVQQQQQQHLLQQQLLQHTIMQQIGQATDGMPQNLPMLQTMIDQLNVQIQNTQQQLQLLRTMNMIGSQPAGSGTTGSSQNILSAAENTSVIDSTSHGNFLAVTCNNVETVPITHSNLLQMCGSSEAGPTHPTQQQSNVMNSINVSTNLQTADQGGFLQNTNQILSNLSPQDQQNIQFFNQLSPSQMQGQTHGNVNNSQNYFNNLSMQNSGHTIIQVQQSPAIPPSQQTQYVQTFLQGPQLQKGRASLNESGSSEQFVIQAYPSMNHSVQEIIAKSSQNSVLIQQLNTPVNQGQRLTVPPLLLVNQQQVDCGDGLPSASHLSKELYDISESGFQQQSNRIDPEHGLLNTPILDLAPAIVMPFVGVSGQPNTESTHKSTNVTGQPITESTHESTNVTGQPITLGTVCMTGQTVTGSSLESTVATDQITTRTIQSTTVNGQSITENKPEPVNVTGQTTRGNSTQSTSMTDQTTTKTTLETLVMTERTTKGTTSESTILTEMGSTLESASVIDQTTAGSTPGSTIVTVVTSVSGAIPFCHVPVTNGTQSVISSGLVTSISAKERDLVLGSTSNNQTGSCYTSTSSISNPSSCSDSSFLHVSRTLPNTNRFHTSPKSAFHTPQKLELVTCSSSDVCTPPTSRMKCLPVGNSQTQNVKLASSVSGNSYQSATIDFIHDVCVPNASVTSLSTCKSKSKSARRSQTTKVTQSRFATSAVPTATVVPSTQSVTATYLSVPMIQGIQRPDTHPSKRSKVNSANKHLAMIPVSANQQAENSTIFLQSNDPETQSSIPENNQSSRQNVTIESVEKVKHSAANVHALTEKGTQNTIADVTHTTTDTTRPNQVMSAPISRTKRTSLQVVTSISQVTQDSINCNTYAPTKSHSVCSHKIVNAPYPQNSIVKLSPKGSIGTTVEKKACSVRPTTPVTKTVSDTSHMLLNFSGLQLQNVLSSVRQSGNDKQHPPNKTARTQSVSVSTVHKESHETPVGDSIHPMNCTLVINQAQKQREVLGPGQGQQIIGQIQPMLLNAANHSRNMSVSASATQTLVDSKNNGDQRTQSITPLPLVPNTTFTIDSETLMRLCQQAALPRSPVVSVDMNTQMNINL
ncbi:uncharacterized protein LOC110447589 isoform X2 [Mizuhopecten yessoensis]|uniref:uncharacterized protein LOC110447589 isoform X2 n=1 Tax=Mizuhopecten yessoensis TaxID=6573 RepID=UPI000B45E47B|nr:uncharacterized protein LOC110447589 isoform X2 [Mizuhopecten yessoensis]